MGIYYQAAIVVGLPYEELDNAVGGERFNEILENDDPRRWSPYYDSDLDDCIFGIRAMRTDDYSYEEVTVPEIDAAVSKARMKWHEMFPDILPKVFLMPYGY
jgi:hypothetical protein